MSTLPSKRHAGCIACEAGCLADYPHIDYACVGVCKMLVHVSAPSEIEPINVDKMIVDELCDLLNEPPAHLISRVKELLPSSAEPNSRPALLHKDCAGHCSYSPVIDPCRDECRIYVQPAAEGTPRTDAAEAECNCTVNGAVIRGIVTAKFARTLELELAEARQIGKKYEDRYFSEAKFVTELEIRLRDQEDTAREHIAYGQKQCHRAETAEASLTAAHADKERAEKDAERWRFVRDLDDDLAGMLLIFNSSMVDLQEMTTDQMDAAIDAAIDRARAEKGAT